ncbi:MAG TPA: hypothetical protein VKB59_10165 [Micromonosporaceae bacterium]|nr:hypothetical protein [Micromonosporaceae bacterium]
MPAPREPSAAGGPIAEPTASGITTEFPKLSDVTVQMARPDVGPPAPGVRPPADVLNERTVNLRPPRSLRRTVRRRSHRVARFLRTVDRRALPPVGRAMANLGHRSIWRGSIASVGAIAAVGLLVLAVYTATRPAAVDDDAAVPVRVGVNTGDSVKTYISRSNAATHDAAQSSNAAGAPTRYALVSLTDYLTPQAFTARLAGTKVVRVFMASHAPSPPAEVFYASVDKVPDDIVAAMMTVAMEKKIDYADAARALQILDHANGKTPDDAAVHDSYEQAQKADAAEEKAFRSQCACVFAAVVHGSVAQLATLVSRPGVRVVDLAPMTGRPDQDVFSPLLPDQRLVAKPPRIVDVAAGD